MGEIQTTPKNIVVKDPLTDQVNKDHVEFHWDIANPFAAIKYQIVDTAGKVLQSEQVKLEPLTSYFSTSFLQELKTVAESEIWSDIQSKYTVEDK